MSNWTTQTSADTNVTQGEFDLNRLVANLLTLLQELQTKSPTDMEVVFVSRSTLMFLLFFFNQLQLRGLCHHFPHMQKAPSFRVTPTLLVFVSSCWKSVSSWTVCLVIMNGDKI